MSNPLHLRTVSGFALSISTALAFESIFTPRQAVYDPGRVIPSRIPISRYGFLWINVLTLVRNAYNALDRSLYSLKQKSGSLKHTLTITPVSSFPLTGNSWVNNRGQFLFQDKTALTGLQAPTETLKNKASAIFSGKLPYFNYHYFFSNDSYQ